MNTTLIPAQRTQRRLTAADYARLALTTHDANCRECGGPNSDSRCPQGAAYEAAATMHTDCPAIEGV